VVGSAISRLLHFPLDVFLSQKLRAPGDPELAMGAITETGSIFLNRDIIRSLWVSPKELNDEIHIQRREIERRRRFYRGGRDLPAVKGRDLILIDDGVATGASFLAALKALRPLKPNSLIAAVPVGPSALIAPIERLADELVILEAVENFTAVAPYYESFSPMSDSEVIRILSFRQGWQGLNRIPVKSLRDR
jgi:putative phosphoribosyl transferase